MKKFIFIILACIAISVNAQYAGNKLTDNISVGFEVGGYTPLQNHAFCGDFAPTFGFTATKYFNPVFGFGAEIQSYVNPKGAAYHTCTFPFMTNIGGLFHVNTTNLLLGYNGKPRPIEFEAIYGLGWGHVWRSGNNNDANFLTSKAGVNVNWNITDAWTLSFRPAVIWDLSRSTPSWGIGNDTHGAQYDINHANLEMKVGITYHFTGSNGKTYMTYAKLYDQNEIDALNEKINLLRSQEPKTIEVEKIIEKVISSPISDTYIITFAQNSAVLTNSAKATLDKIPNKTKVSIVASASPEGTDTYNQKLSEQRAQNIAKYLANNGVEVVDIKALGESSGETSNRIAIVTIVK